MTTPDARIWQSAWNISQAQENLNKLFEAFDLIECRHQGLVIEFDDADECEGEFIQPVWNAYYTVKRKTRSNAKVEGWITLAIQLTCDEGKEASWVFGKRAKVLVGYNPGRDFECAWEFNAGAPNAAGYCDDCEANETHWTFDDDGAISWFYALPLDEMTSVEAVKKLIVAPLHEILKAEESQDPTGVLQGIGLHLCQPPNHSPDHI